MKFLLFNVVVAASLGYLLLGDNRNDIAAAVTSQSDVPEIVVVEEAVVVEKAAVVEEAVVVAKPAIRPARRAPAPVNQEVTVAAAPAPAPEPEATPVSAAAKVAASDPAAARRRAEVLADGPIAADQTATPQFMTPTERRRELARLAEDMELRFLEKVRN